MGAWAFDVTTAPVVALVSVAAAPAIALVLVTTVRNPIWLLAVYAAVVPFGSTLRIPEAGAFGSLSTLIGLLVLAGFVIHLAARGNGRVQAGTTSAYAVLLVGVATTTVVWSIDVPRTVQQATVLASLVGLYLAVAATPMCLADVRRFENGLIAGGSVVGGYALYLAAVGALVDAEDQRFVAALGGSEAGEVADPNITAASLVLPLIVTLHRAMLPGRVGWRLVHFIIAAALLVGASLTGSRGGMLGVLVAVVVVLLIRGRRPGGAWMAAVLVPLTAFFITAVVAPPYVVERLTGDARSSGRTDIWLAGLQACPTHCAIGSGWGTFATAHQEVLLKEPTARGDRLLVEAHNLWLGVLVEGGVVALALLTLIVWSTARDLLTLHPSRRAPPLAALAGLMVTSLFLQTLTFKYFWLVLIYGVLMTNASAERPTDPATGALVASSPRGEEGQ